MSEDVLPQFFNSDVSVPLQGLKILCLDLLLILALLRLKIDLCLLRLQI